DTLEVNELLDSDYPLPTKIENEETLVIVTLCTTGEGGAALIKNILEKQLSFSDNHFKIIPLSILGNENIETKLKNIKEEYRLICVVGSFRVNTDVPQYGIDRILDQSALQDIQKLIDIENAYLKIGDTFENHLRNIDGQLVLQGIKKFIKHIEDSLDIKIATSILIGIAMHMGCMIDRIKSGGNVSEFIGKEPFIQDHSRLYQFIKRECAELGKQYQIEISEDEICHLVVLFNPKNIG
ncbi:MAG TPA: transcription antiterminator BglG, partial [Firmicutes bacterium]|nr:transcription antiterminator BglG [Bacillota bacterium]